jgi:hypothetical protein
MEQARHQAELASRRYEAVNPANRLVAAELEARWNVPLQNATEVAAQLCHLNGSRNLSCGPIRKLWSVWRRTGRRSGTLRRRIGAAFVNLASFVSGTNGAPISLPPILLSTPSNLRSAPDPRGYSHPRGRPAQPVMWISFRHESSAAPAPAPEPPLPLRPAPLPLPRSPPSTPKGPITRPRSCARSAAISAASRAIAYFQSGMIEDLTAPPEAGRSDDR